jgi:hypothetical protein
VTAPVRAEALLSAGEARRLTGQIRDALAVADDLLARAYAGRAWEPLGHRSWEAYCAAELPELRHLKLRAPAREARAAVLLARGASVRDVAAATGASVGSAHATVRKLTEPAPAPVPRAAPVCKTTRTLELLAAAGEAGLTVHQLERRTGWHHGQASAVLARLAAAGRIGYRRPARRGLTGTYVR